MGLIKKIVGRITQKGFARNVVTLMMGTAFSQALLILATPFLTRLYSPEEFGIYGSFLSIAAILTVIISLRYELAIVLPKSNKEAKGLVLLSLIIATGFTVLLFVIILLFGEKLSTHFQWLKIEYLYFIPPYVFLVGMYQIINYWLTRVKGFNSLAIAQTGRSLSTISIQLFTGLVLLLGAYGLIVGQLIGQLIAVTFLLFIIYREGVNTKSEITNLKEIKALAKKYKDFPLYSSWNSFINTISLQVPIIILTFYFSASSAGFYMLGHRLVSMPMGLISSSISQVFLQKLSFDKVNKNKIKSSFKLWKYLHPLSALVSILVILLAPSAFSIIFGEEWIVAGEYARWIALWTLFQFVASPLSSISFTYNKQRLFLGFQIVLLILRIASLVIGGIQGSPIIAIALFSVVSGLFNLVTTGMYIYIEAGKKEALVATFVNLITFLALLVVVILF